MSGSALAFYASASLFIVAIYFYFFDGRWSRSLCSYSKNFFETTPAKQLAPRFDQLVRASDTLVVPTAKGSYPESEPGGALWLEMLERWLESGANVVYLVIGGKTDKCKSIAELSIKYGERFTIKFFDASGEVSDEAHRFAEELYVTHPVFLFSANDEPKALWLERFHSPESGIAMDVSYVAPCDITNSPLTGKYQNRVQVVLDASVAASAEDLNYIVTEAA